MSISAGCQSPEGLDPGSSPDPGPGSFRSTLPTLPVLSSQGILPDCGPHALAMAASCLLSKPPSPEACAILLHRWRVPRLGATLPMALPIVADRLGLRSRAAILGNAADLRAAVDAGHPTVILVHPGPARERWAELHFRVVVGYEVDPMGRIERFLIACSATPHAKVRGWNVTQTPSRLNGEWHNYALPRWYAEFWPA